MLGLTLREEFRGKRLKGTAIELSNDTNTGATQIAAQEFLEITYPTHDLLKGIEAVGPNQGRPVVVIGERGLGNPRRCRPRVAQRPQRLSRQLAAAKAAAFGVAAQRHRRPHRAVKRHREAARRHRAAESSAVAPALVASPAFR